MFSDIFNTNWTAQQNQSSIVLVAFPNSNASCASLEYPNIVGEEGKSHNENDGEPYTMLFNIQYRYSSVLGKSFIFLDNDGFIQFI